MSLSLFCLCLNDIVSENEQHLKYLKGPFHLGKSCYIRGGCVPMNTFDATDYESALRFSENYLVFEKSYLKF